MGIPPCRRQLDRCCNETWGLLPLRDDGLPNLTHASRFENDLACAQRGSADRFGPVEVALQIPGRHSSCAMVDERLQMGVQGVHPSQAQGSRHGFAQRLRTVLLPLPRGPAGKTKCGAAACRAAWANPGQSSVHRTDPPLMPQSNASGMSSR